MGAILLGGYVMAIMCSQKKYEWNCRAGGSRYAATVATGVAVLANSWQLLLKKSQGAIFIKSELCQGFC